MRISWILGGQAEALGGAYLPKTQVFAFPLRNEDTSLRPVCVLGCINLRRSICLRGDDWISALGACSSGGIFPAPPNPPNPPNTPVPAIPPPPANRSGRHRDRGRTFSWDSRPRHHATWGRTAADGAAPRRGVEKGKFVLRVGVVAVVQIEETEEAFLSAEKRGARSRRETATRRRRRGMASRRGARSRHGVTTVVSEIKINSLESFAPRVERVRFSHPGLAT